MTELFVNMGDLQVLRGVGRLTTVGLGSCVGVAIYDSQSRVGGLAHVFLADSGRHKPSDQPGKFADTAIPALLRKVTEAGAKRTNLVAKIAGGAHLFAGIAGQSLNVGKQNVEAVKFHLNQERIRIAGEDVEGTHGRKMILYIDSGRVVVQAIGQPAKEI